MQWDQKYMLETRTILLAAGLCVLAPLLYPIGSVVTIKQKTQSREHRKTENLFFLTHTRLTYTKHTQCCLKSQQKQKSLPLVYNLLQAEQIIN